MAMQTGGLCEQIEEGGDNVAASWQLAHPEETRKFQGTQMTAKKASSTMIGCGAAQDLTS